MSRTDPIAKINHQYNQPNADDQDDDHEPSSNRSSTSVLKSFYARHQVSTEFLRCTSSNNDDDNDDDSNSNTAAGECGRYRFIRLNPRYDRDETLGLLRTELSSSLNNQGQTNGDTSSSSSVSYNSYPIQVAWLDTQWGFYAMPSNFKLAQSDCFRQGRVYGQDVSSGAAVAALLCSTTTSSHHDDDGSSSHDNKDGATTAASKGCREQQHHVQQKREPLRVLDLCCAPGLKLCAMADWLSQGDPQYNNPPTATGQSSFQSLAPLLPTAAGSVIVGVDISESRVALCKRVVEKYNIDSETRGQKATCHGRQARIRMYRADGTTFGLVQKDNDNDDDQSKVKSFSSSLVFDSEASLAQQQDDNTMRSPASGSSGSSGTKRKRLNKSARARLGKRLKQVAQLDCRLEEEKDGLDGDKCKDTGGQRIAVKLFDRVLVDAECSTDGSLKHVQKRMQKEHGCLLRTAADGEDIVGKSKESSAHSNFMRTLTSKQHLDELVDLQKRLAASGFRLLKPGGFMVYSTCSLCVEQNEDVVEWLLKEYDEHATLVPIDFGGSSLLQIQSCGLIKEPKVGMMTFLPNTSSDELTGGGFFLAKIQKKTTHSNGRHGGDDDS